MELRRSRLWSQRELARRSGIRHARLSKLENGHATPNLPELLRLAEALNAGLDEIVRAGSGHDGWEPETVLCALFGAVRFAQGCLEAAGAFGDRLLLRLRYGLGLTLAETAARLGCRPASAGKLVQRAVARVRQAAG